MPFGQFCSVEFPRAATSPLEKCATLDHCVRSCLVFQVAKTNATGERLQEGSNINKSLLTLGQAIHSRFGKMRGMEFGMCMVTNGLGGAGKVVR
jgi:hypothetical protein